jgi:hypothetical protein
MDQPAAIRSSNSTAANERRLTEKERMGNGAGCNHRKRSAGCLAARSPMPASSMADW